MKPTILKLSLFVLLFGVTTAGCQKDESEETEEYNYPFMLHYSIKNEEGQDITRIKEGDKFFIYFSIENITDKDASIDNQNSFFNDELFNIYKKEDHTLLGNPVKLNLCTTIMGCNGRSHIKNEIEVEYPLQNDTIIGFMCCSHKFAKYPELSAGKYYIKYTASVPYFYITEDYQVEPHETGNYNLRYDFEIVK